MDIAKLGLGVSRAKGERQRLEKRREKMKGVRRVQEDITFKLPFAVISKIESMKSQNISKKLSSYLVVNMILYTL